MPDYALNSFFGGHHGITLMKAAHPPEFNARIKNMFVFCALNSPYSRSRVLLLFYFCLYFDLVPGSCFEPENGHKFEFSKQVNILK